MNKEEVYSYLYLRAVLPAMEDLLRVSKEASELTRGWKFTLKMSICGGPQCALKFRDGSVQARRHSSSDLNLVYFKNSLLNAAFENKRYAIPIPFGNPLHFKKLSAFQKLTDLLEKYLKPKNGSLKDERFLRAHAVILFRVLMRAVSIVGELDPIDTPVPSGLAVVEIEGVESACWLRIQDGQYFFGLGVPSAEADVRISFDSVETFLQAAQQQLDSHAAVGLGKIKIRGLVPLADSLSLVMDKVGTYLSV